MGTRGRTSFQKKQKEMERKDRQQRKLERRAQRKLDRSDTPGVPQDDELALEEIPGASRGQVLSRDILEG